MIDRRHFLTLLAGTAFAGSALSSPARASTPADLVVFKTPGCGCCEAWADLARVRGHAVTVHEFTNLEVQKAALGVPMALASCHTIQVDGYVFEGHIPFAAMDAVLRDRPAIVGLAVPGMPMGSPGMGDDPAARFDVIAFGGDAGDGQVFYRAGTTSPFGG